MNKDNILYIAVVLNNESQQKLKNIGQEFLKNSNKSVKWFCHHMTIAFKNDLNDGIINFTEKHLGEDYVLVANRIGLSEKAMAVSVETNAPSNNKIKHVTIAVFPENNGKPYDSNFITEWKDIEPVVLHGNISVIRK